MEEISKRKRKREMMLVRLALTNPNDRGNTA